MKIIILFISVILFSLNLSAANKFKFISKYEFKKLDQVEKEYYVKKLYKIFSQFETRMNKSSKLRASNSLSFPKIFNEAFALTFDPENNCVVGGHILRKRGGYCSYRKHKKTSCDGASGNQQGYLQCGSIYGSVCIPIKNSGASLSKDCKDKALSQSAFKPSYIDVETFKKYVGQVCRGENNKSDGCSILSSQLEVEFQVAEELTQNLQAEKDCKGNSNKKILGFLRQCKIKITNIKSGSQKSYRYKGKDIDALVAAINKKGYLNLPESLNGLDINEIAKQFKSKRGCASVTVPVEVKEHQDLLQNKCRGATTDPSDLSDDRTATQ